MNPHTLTPPQRTRAHLIYKLVTGGVTTAIQCYVSAEILWVLVNPTAPHLYEIALEKARTFRERIIYRMQVMETLRSIRRLPDDA